MPTALTRKKKLNRADKPQKTFAQLKREAHILANKYTGRPKPKVETPVKPGDVEC